MKSKGRKNNLFYRLAKNKACYLGLAPFFIMLILFVFFPILRGVIRSFTNWSMNTREPLSFVGLENYRLILGGTSSASVRFLKSLKNLLYYVPSTIIVGLAISLFLALIVNQFRKKHQRLFNFFRGVYYIPTVLPLFLCTGVWMMFMASDSGVFSQFLIKIFPSLADVNWTNDPGYAIAFVVIVDIWNAVGFNFIIFSAGMQDIPEELYEASSIDGASAWQQMRQITLPLLEPVIFFVITNSFISALQVYDIPWIVTAKADIDTVGGTQQVMLFPVMEMVRNVYNGASSGLGRACAEGVILMLIIMSVTLLMFRIRRKKT